MTPSDRHAEWTEAGTIDRRLDVAVALTDGYTGRPPVGTPRVALVGTEATAARNPSGYYTFWGLPDGVTDVTVEVDAAGYLAERRTVALPALDPLAPVVDVTLSPSSAYSFPRGETVVRGAVRDGGAPIPGATVAIAGRGYRTRTDERGGYALALTGLDADDVTREDGTRIVRFDGDDPRVDVTHPDGTTTSKSVPVALGATVSAEFSR